MDFVARANRQMTEQLIKHSWSEVPVYVDWRPYAEFLETTLVASEWVAEPGILLVNPFLSGYVASCEIGGGVPADVAYVENRVRFQDGSRDVFRLRVQMIGTA